MPNILTPRHLPMLAQFAASNVLVAFDYDGTLAPIVTDPRARGCARQPRGCCRPSRSATRVRRFPAACAPIWPATSRRFRSGHLAGNHGIEPWGESERFASRVRRWVAPLRRQLDGEQGIVVEDKA